MGHRLLRSAPSSEKGDGGGGGQRVCGEHINNSRSLPVTFSLMKPQGTVTETGAGLSRAGSCGMKPEPHHLQDRESDGPGLPPRQGVLKAPHRGASRRALSPPLPLPAPPSAPHSRGPSGQAPRFLVTRVSGGQGSLEKERGGRGQGDRVRALSGAWRGLRGARPRPLTGTCGRTAPCAASSAAGRGSRCR